MDDQVKDKIKGVIFGNAIGDAIGLGTEFMPKQMLHKIYPKGLHSYEQIFQDKHRKRWKPGEWTDDTDQMLCILDSIVATKKVDVKDIALTILDWAHNDGRGLGRTVYTVITSPVFMQKPQEAAKNYGVSSGKFAAANGGIMRTSVLGIWEYHNLAKVRINAEKVCKITHYDPRCIGSCVMLCTLISALLEGQTVNEQLIEQILQEGDQYDDRIRTYIQQHVQADITTLDLDDKSSIGYTLKALSCGIWAVQYATSFEQGVQHIIHEGGDADTNAAVAGAVLGAKFGYNALPESWKNGLLKKDWLLQETNKLIQLMEESLV